MVLLQLETPLETIEHAINMCHKHDVPVILNPALQQVLYLPAFYQKYLY